MGWTGQGRRNRRESSAKSVGMDAVQTRGEEGKMERSEEERREQGTRRAWIGIPRANQNRGMESLIWSHQVWQLGAGGPRVRLRSRGSPGRSGSGRTRESGRGVGCHLAGLGAGGPASQAEGSGVTWQVWELGRETRMSG